MDSSMNHQKVIRTGDLLLDNQTNKKVKVHYVKEFSGQLSFESQVNSIEEVQVDDGDCVSFVPISRLKLLPRR